MVNQSLTTWQGKQKQHHCLWWNDSSTNVNKYTLTLIMHVCIHYHFFIHFSILAWVGQLFFLQLDALPIMNPCLFTSKAIFPYGSVFEEYWKWMAHNLYDNDFLQLFHIHMHTPPPTLSVLLSVSIYKIHPWQHYCSAALNESHMVEMQNSLWCF